VLSIKYRVFACYPPRPNTLKETEGSQDVMYMWMLQSVFCLILPQ